MGKRSGVDWEGLVGAVAVVAVGRQNREREGGSMFGRRPRKGAAGCWCEATTIDVARGASRSDFMVLATCYDLISLISDSLIQIFKGRIEA